MDNLQAFKEKAINNYLSNINLNELDTNQLKQDLKALLGEEPAVQMNYISEKAINEDGSDGKRIEKLDSVTITFTINKEVMPGTEIPFPISKKFLLD